MSDTRTIYLLTQDDIYCSDPQIKQSSDLPLTYLDMSEFDNLNPTRGTVVSGLAGAVSTYEPYEATVTLTFKNREERAEWIQKNSEQVYQIAVANTINQNRVYNKKCAITSFEFVENPYTNGIQTVLTLKLFGKWQSSLTEIEINSGTYSGGTKSYSVDAPVREIGEGVSGVAGEPEEDGRVPYTHTAWSWSSDGTDRFTIQYPGENLLLDSDIIRIGTGDNFGDLGPAGTAKIDLFNSFRGKTITISFDVEWSNWSNSEDFNNRLGAEWHLYFYDGSDYYIRVWEAISQESQSKHRYSTTVTVPDKEITLVEEGSLYNQSNAAATIGHTKIEVGNTPTAWTPAPEEDPVNAYPLYRGEYTDYTEADSTDPSVYTWGTPRVKKTYAYDSKLRYGITHYVSAIKLDGEHGFVLATKPRNGGLTVNLQSDYNGHQFALESNWPNLITGLSSEFVAYPYTSFTAIDRFTMLAGGTVTSYGWNIENNEMPYLYEMFNNVEKYPVSVGAVDQNGTLVPIHVYTYTAQDFI